MAETVIKFPYKRVEPSVQRFINVCRIDLERVRRHKINLGQMQLTHDWKNLHKEQINASRTIQQMCANLRELQKTRSRVLEDDLEKFDAKVKDVSEECVAAVAELVQLYHDTENASKASPPDSDEKTEQQPLMTNSLHTSMLGNSAPTVDPPSISLQQQQEELQAQRMAQASLDDLGHSIEELNLLMHEFSKVVHSQGEKVDTIEDHIETAHENVTQGTGYLEKALKLKVALYPIAGALVGGAVGGPIGLLAGLKLGAVAAGVGGLAGTLIY